jgi:hypothetical protein
MTTKQVFLGDVSAMILPSLEGAAAVAASFLRAADFLLPSLMS